MNRSKAANLENKQRRENKEVQPQNGTKHPQRRIQTKDLVRKLVPSSAEKIHERVDSGRCNRRTYQTKSSSRSHEKRKMHRIEKTEPGGLNPGH